MNTRHVKFMYGQLIAMFVAFSLLAAQVSTSSALLSVESDSQPARIELASGPKDGLSG